MADIENNVIDLAARLTSMRSRLANQETDAARMELAELRSSLRNLAAVLIIAAASHNLPSNYDQINATLDDIAVELRAIMAALGMS